MAVTYMPAGYNWWEQNRFRMPPLPNVARPTYASLLGPVAENATNPQSLAALNAAGVSSPNQPSFGGFGEAGSAPSFGPVGMNATTTNFRDLLSGPITAPVSLAGQAIANYAAGNPNRAITSATLEALGNAIAEAFSGAGLPGTGADFGVDRGQPPGPNTTGGMPDPTGTDPAPSPPDPQPGPEAEHDDFRVGGLIPADGDRRMESVAINAHEGEFVLRPEAVKHYGKGLLSALNDRKIDKKKMRGLLG